MSLLLFLVVGLTSFGQRLSTLRLLVLNGLLAPPLPLHILLALLLFGNLLALHLLPRLALVLSVVGLLGVVTMRSHGVGELPQMSIPAALALAVLCCFNIQCTLLAALDIQLSLAQCTAGIKLVHLGRLDMRQGSLDIGFVRQRQFASGILLGWWRAANRWHGLVCPVAVGMGQVGGCWRRHSLLLDKCGWLQGEGLGLSRFRGLVVCARGHDAGERHGVGALWWRCLLVVRDVTGREGIARCTHLILYRGSPRVGLWWWRLDRRPAQGVVAGGRHGRARHSVHVGWVGTLRGPALQRRAVCVLDDGRVVGALVRAVSLARVGVGVWVASLLAVHVSS